MEITTGQNFYYTNKEPLSVEDVVDSLLALKSLIETAPEVLERIAPGLNIYRVQIHVNEILTGSLIEDFVVKFFWGNQESLTTDIERAREALKINKIMENKKLLACIVIALILGGGIYLLNKSTAPEEQRAILQGNQNTVIVIGAGLTGMSPEDFKSIIDSTVAKNANVPKDAVNSVKPAKREDGASIQTNQSADVSIDSRAVKAMPSYSPENDAAESVEDFEAVEISIRATDLDSTKRGWAAVLPAISDRRTKLHLDPNIRTDDLMKNPHLKGDVTVVFKYNEKGEKIPSLVFLRQIIK